MLQTKSQHYLPSPYSKNPFNIKQVLSDIKYDSYGRISGAGLIKTTYFIERLADLVNPADDVSKQTFGSVNLSEINTNSYY